MKNVGTEKPMNAKVVESTSLREHSNVLRIFTSCDRSGQSSRRQMRFATRASAPNIAISVEMGVTPPRSFSVTSIAIQAPKPRMMMPFASAAPARPRPPDR